MINDFYGREVLFRSIQAERLRSAEQRRIVKTCGCHTRLLPVVVKSIGAFLLAWGLRLETTTGPGKISEPCFNTTR